MMLTGIGMSACSPTSAPVFLPPPGPMARQMVAERLSAVVVTKQQNIDGWTGSRFSAGNAPDDGDGGSAAPVSPDGYFLTADHVLSRMEGRNVFVIFRTGREVLARPARVVWRSAGADLALLHVRERTPYFYSWTPPNRLLPEGTEVIHGGMSTGFRQGTGRLGTPLKPETPFTGNRKFKLDIPLQPGDSGGPVVEATGSLVGINSAVEFLVPLETAFFVDSEGNRPNVRKIEDLIRRDRARNDSGQ